MASHSSSGSSLRRGEPGGFEIRYRQWDSSLAFHNRILRMNCLFFIIITTIDNPS